MRHTSVAIEKGLCYGQLNVPLSDSFPQEKAEILTKLPRTFDVILTSPLDRCVRLANAISKNNVQQDTRLMEVHFGDWEGKKWNDLDQEILNGWMSDFVHVQPPNGESAQDLFQRVAAFLEELRSKDYKKCLIVAHAGSIRAILCSILGHPVDNMFRVHVNYGTVVRINLGTDSCQDALLSIQ